jgi:hypothetical protein
MFATYENFSYLCTRKQILERIMETTTQEQIAMFRANKP